MERERKEKLLGRGTLLRSIISFFFPPMNQLESCLLNDFDRISRQSKRYLLKYLRFTMYACTYVFIFARVIIRMFNKDIGKSLKILFLPIHYFSFVFFSRLSYLPSLSYSPLLKIALKNRLHVPIQYVCFHERTKKSISQKHAQPLVHPSNLLCTLSYTR